MSAKIARQLEESKILTKQKPKYERVFKIYFRWWVSMLLLYEAKYIIKSQAKSTFILQILPESSNNLSIVTSVSMPSIHRLPRIIDKNYFSLE